MNNYKILIVDDEPLILEVVSEFFLEKLKCEVHTALNGLEGLQQAQNIKCDFILIDYNMPIMNGAALVKSIRELKNLNTNTPLIVFSAFIEDIKPLVNKFKNIYFLDKSSFQTHVLDLINKIVGSSTTAAA
ncbi:MAG: response regulator [Oligoflexia bacterium]|nr:response regulator [Oligoflexia bacterium]